MAWWIKASSQGRPVVLGWYNTEEEANTVGFQQLGGDFEAYELPTTDKARATAMIKAKILNQTSDLDMALRRVSHKLPNNPGDKDVSDAADIAAEEY